MVKVVRLMLSKSCSAHTIIVMSMLRALSLVVQLDTVTVYGEIVIYYLCSTLATIFSIRLPSPSLLP